MTCADCDNNGCPECRLPRLPRYHHCDRCDSDHDVTLVDYDPMSDGPGDIVSEWLCQECRNNMTVAELRVMLKAGLVRASGRTGDGRVTSYSLTHAGRVLLSHALKRDP